MADISDLHGGFGSIPTLPDYVQLIWTPSGESLTSLYYCYGVDNPGDLSAATIGDLPGGFYTESIPTDWTNVGFNMYAPPYDCGETFYFVILEIRALDPDQEHFSNVTVSLSEECETSDSCYGCKGFWQVGKGIGGKSIPRV
jgi:hypothetical protein